MLRIINPKGILTEIKKVIPVVEKLDNFNGKIKYRYEEAIDMTVNPTALVLHNISMPDVFNSDTDIYLGNFTPQEVKKILNSLLVNGYYDFSQYKYQSFRSIDEVTVDNGKSLPFYTELHMLQSYAHFPINPFASCSYVEINGTDNECSDEDDFDDEV